MTFSEEFNSTETDVDFDEVGSSYPTAFGITFTPQISGICLGVLGLLGSIYVGFNFVKPAYDNYTELKATEAEKQGQVAQQQSGELSQKMLEAEQKLRESEALRSDVLSLFSSEESLKTILFDINQLVQKHQAKLVSFSPNGGITVVRDSSLGEGANDRLKSQKLDLTIRGDFVSTQSLLRDLERLQPLLVITGLNSKLVKEQFTIEIVEIKQEGGESVATGQAISQGNNALETSFTLDAILPLSPEELAKLNSEAEGPEEGEQSEQQ
ncbi:pilus assembly protein [Crocosphaera sp.]|uniref:pilus assembly protein n=1 Tax=Crocosphaera sp. TaxID=2729996 RepID=UPI00260D7801|nr:pilus assembly protein [Crocosphaera sp.]MDJ0582774.1 pilus assembly protein [Crocosphaera sp.]